MISCTNYIRLVWGEKFNVIMTNFYPVTIKYLLPHYTFYVNVHLHNKLVHILSLVLEQKQDRWIYNETREFKENKCCQVVLLKGKIALFRKCKLIGIYWMFNYPCPAFNLLKLLDNLSIQVLTFNIPSTANHYLFVFSLIHY